MKGIFTIMIAICITYIAFSQSYSILYNNGTRARWIHITIDTNLAADCILVEKEFITNSVDTILAQNDLLLLGDFKFDQDSANLDFDRYNYFCIPFYPSEPFYYVDHLFGTTNHGVTLYYQQNTASYAGGDDIVYWYDREDHSMADNDTGMGCVTTVSPKGLVHCIKSGNAGSHTCIGQFTGMPIANPGGGIMIQVSCNKGRLIHNFGTGHW